MGHVRDSSLLFSLQSLLDVERERVDADRAEREQRLIEARRQRERAEQRARDAEQARLDEERRRQAEREHQARAQAARLEGIRQAELERVKLETARQAELELAARRQEHEQRLATLAVESRRRGGRFFAGVAAAIGVFVTASAAVYFVHIVPQDERLAARNQDLLARSDAVAAEVSEVIERTNRHAQTLAREKAELVRRLREAHQVAPAAGP
jgi:colicin import membrane protein